MIDPRWGKWIFPVALLPWVIRIIAGQFPFQRTSLDWFIIIFLVTAWIGYCAAYDKTTAWNKVWLIMIAILAYYALAGQPKENLSWISLLFFCIGVGISLYFLLTYDFIAVPRKLEFANRLGPWLMSIRPQTELASLHPNYMSGFAAITAPFILYPTWSTQKNSIRKNHLFFLFVLLGLGIVVTALLMATSRGVVMAILSGLGVWLVWRCLHLNGIKHRVKSEAVFPFLVLVYLCIVVTVLYIGPAHSKGLFSGHYYYGDGSRAELFARSLYLLKDYPFTGGGLGSFPGLYSRYLLDIPHLNVSNSHNLFLDVAIEQGMFGGTAFILMYIASIWFVSRSLAKEATSDENKFKWILLFSLVVAFVHGMVDDYLFNGNGTIFSLFLLGLSAPAWKFREQLRRYKLERRIAGVGLFALVVITMFNPAKVLSTWYANLGAVQLSQVELAGFPERGWTGSEIVPHLAVAKKTLHTSLRFDPENRTANQRLGLILTFSQDFESACKHLETANIVTPDHRGIVKSLGYCYVWMGNIEKAAPFLARIPEVREELDVYIWWWETQGRPDLSQYALLALHTIEAQSNQP
jgi:hypothetical protein